MDYFCLNEEEMGQMCWAGSRRDVWVNSWGDVVHYIVLSFVTHIYFTQNVFFNMDLALVKSRDCVNTFTYSITAYLRLIYL